MGHVAGVRNDAGDEESLRPCERHGGRAEALRRRARCDSSPETSSESRVMAGSWSSAAVEAAAGEPFFAYMRTKMFEPLGMEDTRPIWRPKRSSTSRRSITRDSAATRVSDRRRHAKATRPALPAPPRFSPPHGSCPVRTTRIGNGKVLQPATVEMLRASQRLRLGEETGYGLGWKLETLTSRAAGAHGRSWHEGRTSSGAPRIS